MRTLLWLLLLVQRTGALLLPTRRPYSARPLVRPVRHTWCIADGGGGAGGPVSGSGGGGGGGDDDGDEDLLPSELLAALEAGRIGATELANWKNVISNPFTKALAASTFIRNRLLAEPRKLIRRHKCFDRIRNLRAARQWLARVRNYSAAAQKCAGERKRRE